VSACDERIRGVSFVTAHGEQVVHTNTLQGHAEQDLLLRLGRGRGMRRQSVRQLVVELSVA